MPGVERQIPVIGCWLLVLLRLAIGWHLMYEGLWKIQSQHTTAPWSAEGYLKNATGPMRGYFRNLTGDPDDLKWLDYDAMSGKWNAWQQRFDAHYFPASDQSEATSAAKAKLEQMLHGQAAYSVKLDKLPDSVAKAAKENVIVRTKVGGEDENILWYDPANKLLVVDGRLHLLPKEKKDALDIAKGDAKFKKALEDLDKQQAKLSFQERLAAQLKGDPDRIGILQKAADGAVIESRMGEIEQYRKTIARYEAKLRETKQAFQWNHLERLWRELQDQRRQLVSPIQAMENELKQDAEKLLTAAQLAKGPAPEPMTPIGRLNWQTMWGLTILGGLLIAGLFTRLASFAGAGLLMMFYLAVPPLPGTPPEAGPEHNFIVNKVLVESLALLAFASLPSGRWFGMDAVISALWRRGRNS